MPQKLNKAGKMQDYIPKGNGDASGEYGTSNGTNKNFTTSDKKKTEANVITENKSVVVGDKKTTYKGDLEQQEKSLKNRIENLEGVIKNIENGDPAGAEDLQDMKRRLKNYKEDYERQFGKDSNRLRKILEERNQNEDIDHAIDTDYFGFGSLDKLEEAHKNNYGKAKANIIDNDLSGKKEETFEDFYNNTFYTKDGNFYKKSGRDGSVKKISQKDYELNKDMANALNEAGKKSSQSQKESIQKDTMGKVLNKQFIPFESVDADVREPFKKQVVNDFYKLHKDSNHTYTEEEVKKVVDSYNAWFSGSFTKQEIRNLTDALNKAVK